MLAALGADVRVVGIVGADAAGADVRRHLVECGAAVESLIESNDRPTVSKVRLVGLAQHRHPQQMIRLDFEDPTPVPAELAGQILQRVTADLRSADLVCLEDYNKGVLSPEVCRQVIASAQLARVPVLIDPANINDYTRYAGATALKLNRTETARATGLPVNNPEQYDAAATLLLDRLNLEAVVITLDKSGAYLATRDGERRWLKTRARQVYDVTGAGDMVLAMLAMARAAGASWVEAVSLANVAGGLEVEKFGSVPVTREEIIQELLSEVREHLGKERTLEHLVPELQRHRATGKRIVFTNGCFDLMHLGHAKYFQFAKQQGDLLVVGVNTDSSIRRLKGERRPVTPESDRVGLLEEMQSIDYLVRFDDDTPTRLIEAIRPDVLVKGADYRKDQVVGWELVESYGGRIALAPLVDGRSTSAVIQKILEAYS
jgi:D-beta-D-heptose 7-phosphate kinase/D-beta-D-heptose 1-phosphate adenosyltransferase